MKNPLEFFKNMQKIQDVGTLFLKLIAEGPKDVKECSSIFTEVSRGVKWLIKHISITTVTSGLLLNLATNWMSMGTDGASMASALLARDWFKLGDDMGDFVMQLFN